MTTPLSLSPVEESIAVDALDLTLEHLRRHGTDAGTRQRESLHALMRTYAAITFGKLEGRIAVPLPTGWGKSTSAAAWVITLHRSGRSESVAIAASKVEALCELLRNIRDLAEHAGCLAGLDEKLGLLHRHRFNHEKAAEYLAGLAPLPERFASEPSTARDEIGRRQFVLLTHARLEKGEGAMPEYAYRGQPRHLIIHDEALIPGDVIAVTVADVEEAVAALGKRQARDPSFVEAWEYLHPVADMIAAAEKADGGEGSIVSLPGMEPERAERIAAALARDRRFEALSVVCKMTGGEARVHPQAGATKAYGGLVTYRVSVPNALRRMVILDGSFAVNRLYEVDDRVTPWSTTEYGRPIPATGLKDYSRVTVRHMKAGGGYSTVQSDARGERKLIADIVSIVKEVPKSESVLIFTYKDRSSASRPSGRDIDLEAAIKASLVAAGVDVKERVSVRGKPRHRINVLTWGRETSSNDFSHCSTVILPGILRLPFAESLGRYLAATEDLGSRFGRSTERDLVLGQLANLGYQAASRGTSRITDANGRALPMTLWVVDKDEQIKAELDKVMPGAQWAAWTGTYSTGKAPAIVVETRIDLAFVTVRRFLQGITPTVEKVSTRRMWEQIDPNRLLTVSQREETIKRFRSPIDGWVHHGRSLIRDDKLHKVTLDESTRLFKVEEGFSVVPTARPPAPASPAWDF